MTIKTRTLLFNVCIVFNGGRNVHKDPSNLLNAISKALGRKLDKKGFSDRFMMQKGCYILNSWGYGPMYNFSLYIRGPYSSELADDYYAISNLGGVTTVPDEAIYKLADVMKKGVEYTEAYATVLLVMNNNPNRTSAEIMSKALSIKPHLKEEVAEACSSLLT